MLGSQKYLSVNRVCDPLSQCSTDRTLPGIEPTPFDCFACKVRGLHHCARGLHLGKSSQDSKGRSIDPKHRQQESLEPRVFSNKRTIKNCDFVSRTMETQYRSRPEQSPIEMETMLHKTSNAQSWSFPRVWTKEILSRRKHFWIKKSIPISVQINCHRSLRRGDCDRSLCRGSYYQHKARSWYEEKREEEPTKRTIFQPKKECFHRRGLNVETD